MTGIAGGAEKCRWLVEECGFDAALDYKAADFETQFAEASKDGWDVLFDNVGNASVDRALPGDADEGRIVISGQVADYNLTPQEAPGIHNHARIPSASGCAGRHGGVR